MPPIPPTLRTLCLTAAAVLALAAPAQAKTIQPSTNADVRANDGRCSLREAITASNKKTPSGTAAGECPAGEGADTIKLGATTYALSGAAGDDANLSGDLDILESLSLVGDGPGSTVIDAKGVDRVIDVVGNPTGTAQVTIDGVKVTGGKAPDGTSRPASSGSGDATGDVGGAGTHGGGILNRATLTVRNSAVTGNKAGTGGRGGNANAADGDPTMIDPGFAATGGNGGPGGDGGGIRSEGKLLTVENSTVTGNAAGSGGQGGVGFGGDGATGSGSAGGEKGGTGTGGRGGAGGNGGGIFAAQRLKVVDSTIRDNTSGPGGAGNTGVGGFGGYGGSGWSPGGPGATGTGGRGGRAGVGAAVAAEADADVRRTLLAGNNAGAGGPGGNGVGGGGGDRIGTSWDGNRGANGAAGSGGTGGDGGSGAGLVTGGPATIENITVSGNAAGDAGKGGDAIGGGAGNGQIGGLGTGGDALAGNGGEGGGAAGLAQVQGGTLSHVTVFENTVGGGGQEGTTLPGGGQPAGRSQPGTRGKRGTLGAVWPAGGTTRLRNSIVASNSGGNCSGTIADGGRNVVFGDASCPGTQADPKLGALADNGGPSLTHSIPGDSPAHDAVPASGANCPATDQRGTARPQGAACDSGAFELGPPPVTGDGPRTDDPGTGSGADTVAPAFTSASLTAKVFRVDRRGKAEAAVAARSKRGTTFRYALSEQARVTVTIERLRTGRKRRYVRVGRFAVASKSGENRHRFSGRIGRRALKPGRYRATLGATDAAGNVSKPRRLAFRVTRR